MKVRLENRKTPPSAMPNAQKDIVSCEFSPALDFIVVHGGNCSVRSYEEKLVGVEHVIDAHRGTYREYVELRDCTPLDMPPASLRVVRCSSARLS